MIVWNTTKSTIVISYYSAIEEIGFTTSIVYPNQGIDLNVVGLKQKKGEKC